LVIMWARNVPIARAGTLDVDNLGTDLALMTIGALGSLLWLTDPLMVPLCLGPLFLIYRSLLVPFLQEEARTDPKTELFNMKHWNQVAEMEIDRARRFNRPLSVLLGDLDLLREANNRYGHLMGDQLIRRVAETIRGALREYDVPARFGGDEFAVQMPEANLDGSSSRHRTAAGFPPPSASVSPSFRFMGARHLLFWRRPTVPSIRRRRWGATASAPSGSRTTLLLRPSRPPPVAVRSHEGVSLFRSVARLHGILDARPEFLLDPVPCDQDLDSLEPQVTLFHLTLSVAALQGAHRVEAQVWQQPRVRDHHLGPLTRVLRHGATIRLCWLGGCAQDPPHLWRNLHGGRRDGARPAAAAGHARLQRCPDRSLPSGLADPGVDGLPGLRPATGHGSPVVVRAFQAAHRMVAARLSSVRGRRWAGRRIPITQSAPDARLP
ncbi:MAG: diguanylate cyclase, partial [Chloroflexi bacterium]